MLSCVNVASLFPDSIHGPAPMCRTLIAQRYDYHGDARNPYMDDEDDENFQSVNNQLI